MREFVEIILVNPQHPGNIGAAARAMKTMGLSALRLVNPQEFPSPIATERATRASDIVNSARCVDTLEAALGDIHIAFATSTRERIVPWPQLTPGAMAQQVVDRVLQQQRIALVFGAERAGLSNHDLEQCHYHVTIPANPDYSSLNLAAAVQILCYECYVAWQNHMDHSNDVDTIPLSPDNDQTLATGEQLQGLYDHLESALIHSQFLNPHAPKKLMTRLRCLLQRSQCTQIEVNILRGICHTLLRGHYD